MGALYIGFLFSGFSAFQFVSMLICGRLSDRIGRRPVLLVLLFGAATGFLCSAVSTTYWQLLASRCFTGIFTGSPPLAMAIISDTRTGRERDFCASKMASIVSAAFAVGPVISGLLVDYWSQNAPFILAAAFSYVTFAVALFRLQETRGYVIPPPPVTDDGTKVHPSRQVPLSALLFPSWILYALFFAGCMATIAYTSYFTTYGLLISDVYGYGELAYAIITSGIAIASIIILPVVPWLLRAVGKHILLTMSLVVFGLSLFVIPFVGPFNGQIVILSFTAFSWAFILPQILALVGRYSHSGKHGKNQGTSQAIQSVGRVLGPIIGGYLYDIDVRLPYLCLSLLPVAGAVAVLCVYVVNKRIHHKNDSDIDGHGLLLDKPLIDPIQ